MLVERRAGRPSPVWVDIEDSFRSTLCKGGDARVSIKSGIFFLMSHFASCLRVIRLESEHAQEKTNDPETEESVVTAKDAGRVGS
jgi:hypothetical protein